MSTAASADTQGPLWEVFVQEEGGAAHVHAGSVHAPDREMALQNARDVYARRGRVAGLGVLGATCIAATPPPAPAGFFKI
jgi:ring-1,2-phenylacetyl-CoA epoxidase subunit PaaB